MNFHGGKEDMGTYRMSSENIKRITSGIVIVLMIIGGILAGGIFWLLVTAAIASFSLWEYYILLESNAHLSKGIGIIGSLILFLVTYRGLFYLSVGPLLAVFAFIILLTEILRRHLTGESNALWNLGGTLSGLILVSLPWIFIFHLRTFPRGLYFLLTLFLCTWACDVCAYIVGTKWGEKHLSEKVSPNKTWEGFIGGLCGSLLGGALVSYILSLHPLPFILIGCICGIAGQMGDLAESLLKRESGVKDSSDIIPGHGGFFDRFDSILISGTLTYLVFGVIIG